MLETMIVVGNGVGVSGMGRVVPLGNFNMENIGN